MVMLAMTILVHFWVLYWGTAPPTRTQGQLAALYCSLATWAMLVLG
jgi:hypothetical protein